MRVVVPFAATAPKTRLSPVLSPAERSRVAEAMLADVLTTLTETGHEATILATTPVDLEEYDIDPTCSSGCQSLSTSDRSPRRLTLVLGRTTPSPS